VVKSQIFYYTKNISVIQLEKSTKIKEFTSAAKPQQKKNYGKIF